MIVKKRFFAILAIISLISEIILATNVNGIEQIKIGESSFYIYKIERGDSFYGISKKNDWDLAKLMLFNKNDGADLPAGSYIYYPVDQESEVNDNSAIEESNYETIEHLIKKGETVYSIARLYGVSVNQIYEENPQSRYGISAGNKLFIGQNEKNQDEYNNGNKNDIIYYKIKPGDTLYAVSRQYKTTIEHIMLLNPGLSEQNFRSGEIIKLCPESRNENKTIQIVKKKVVDVFEIYKIGRDDTWQNIAAHYKIGIDDLLAANPGVEKLKRGKYIGIPHYKDIEVKQEVIATDIREETPSGREEIYADIHNIERTVCEPQQRVVNLAVILDTKNNKSRDAEFLKGCLMAIDTLKNNFKINLKVYDVSNQETPLAEIIKKSEFKDNDLIFATFDKNFPQDLVNFGNDNDIEIVNLFDIQSLQFEDNQSIIQLLPPTEYFNDAVQQYLNNDFNDYTYVFIGETSKDEDDALDKKIKNELDLNQATYKQITSLDLLEGTVFDEMGRYIFYPQITKKNEIEHFISIMTKLMEKYPTMDVTVLGRPNWLLFTENMKEQLCRINTYIPSRFYLDKDDFDEKMFEEKFKDNYGYQPLKNNPVFSVLGYDVTKFFLSSCVENRGDFNKGTIDYNALQTDFKIERISNWSGFLNKAVYLIHMTQYGMVEKIKI